MSQLNSLTQKCVSTHGQNQVKVSHFVRAVTHFCVNESTKYIFLFFFFFFLRQNAFMVIIQSLIGICSPIEEIFSVGVHVYFPAVL